MFATSLDFFTHILTMIIFGLCFFCDAKFYYFSKFQKTKIVLSLKVINKCYFAMSRMVQYFIFVRSLSCVQLIHCDPVDCSMPGFPVLHCLLEFAQTHVHWVSDAIQPSFPASGILLQQPKRSKAGNILFCSLLYTQYLEQCLGYSRLSINFSINSLNFCIK